MADNAETSRGTLHRIANSLGISVHCFFDSKHLKHMDGACQCLMLWQGIKSEAGQRKALAYLRQLADEEAKGTGPVALSVASQKE